MDTQLGIGIVGATLILLAFLLRKHPKWGTGTAPYQITNVCGAALLTYYAWVGEVWPFVVLNGVWMLDAARALLKRL